MTIIKLIEVTPIIDRFSAYTPCGKSQWMKQKVFSLVCFVALDQIPKIKICHMVVSEYPEVIEGRQRLILVDVLEPEEEDEDVYIDDDGDALDEEGESGWGEVCVRTCVT